LFAKDLNKHSKFCLRKREMEAIEHKTVSVNGINMHVAELGQGPVVLFLHGFPELWYTWRHQMVYMAAHGYRAVAPDLRGFGDTAGAPTGDAAKFTTLHVVGDIVALIDALATPDQGGKVFLVAHDWGALVAWALCLYRPEKVKGLVNMSFLFTPRNPKIAPLDQLRAVYGEDYYICRIQEPGEIEAEFAQMGTKMVLEKFLTYRTPGPLYLPKGKGFGDSSEPVVLPSWLSEADVDYYTSKYEQTGFTGGLNYYRALNLNWELTAAWTGAQVKVPVKFIVGELDLTYNAPGTKDYIHKGGFRKNVPLLQDVVVMEGVAHFLHEEKPDEINKHIHDFLKQFSARSSCSVHGHNTVTLHTGITMHVAEKGEGQLILFLHGFPELWYSWRHQILHAAASGYLAEAPDLRGYGDTAGAPVGDAAKFTTLHVVGDLIALLDAVAGKEEKMFVAGHDWGAYMAWHLCLYRPDRVKAVVNLSVPFLPRNLGKKTVEAIRAAYGDEHYICRFQEPGEIEAVFAQTDAKTVLRKFLTFRDPSPLFFPKGKACGDLFDAPIILPSWLLEEDLYYYAGKFEHTGNWELNAPWTGAQVKVPAKFVVGDLDLVYHMPGTKEYIHNGGLQRCAALGGSCCTGRAPLGDITIHLVGDVVALIDAIALDEDKVFVVGHDWGAHIAWHLCLFRPDRVKALQHGEIEAELAPLGTERVVKKFLTFRTPGPLYFPKGKGFGDSLDTPIVLPSWLSQQDVDYFTSKFEKTGFTGGVNYYRALDLNWELTAAWTGAQKKGANCSMDWSSSKSASQVYCGGAGPDLQCPRHQGLHTQGWVQEGCATFVGRGCNGTMEDRAHFLHEEKADEIIKHIHDFLKQFSARSSCSVS
ncbi:hypothetical protein RJ639_005724, partial [Escallonia herrerae]